MTLPFVPGRAYSQDEHARINHDATPDDPGTRLVCDLCHEFSGCCEEDGFFYTTPDAHVWHFCPTCLWSINELQGPTNPDQDT